MKKFIMTILFVSLMVLYVGCHNQTTNQQDDVTTSQVQDISHQEALVVYFSWSGNTESVAQSIQEQTGADLFEIIPEQPYTDNYDALLDIAQEEQSQDARPLIANPIENIDNYDVIYVGYPNWWGDMPMIMYTFFDTYDLSQKTIAPFCTSGGSGLSDTVNAIKELEPDAIVTEGLHIGSSQASNPHESVQDWLNSIGGLN